MVIIQTHNTYTTKITLYLHKKMYFCIYMKIKIIFVMKMTHLIVYFEGLQRTFHNPNSICLGKFCSVCLFFISPGLSSNKTYRGTAEK